MQRCLKFHSWNWPICFGWKGFFQFYIAKLFLTNCFSLHKNRRSNKQDDEKHMFAIFCNWIKWNTWNDAKLILWKAQNLKILPGTLKYCWHFSSSAFGFSPGDWKILLIFLLYLYLKLLPGPDFSFCIWKWFLYCITFSSSIHSFPISFFRKIEQRMNEWKGERGPFIQFILHPGFLNEQQSCKYLFISFDRRYILHPVFLDKEQSCKCLGFFLGICFIFHPGFSWWTTILQSFRHLSHISHPDHTLKVEKKYPLLKEFWRVPKSSKELLRAPKSSE